MATLDLPYFKNQLGTRKRSSLPCHVFGEILSSVVQCPAPAFSAPRDTGRQRLGAVHRHRAVAFRRRLGGCRSLTGAHRSDGGRHGSGSGGESDKHFILVHGIAHGAWCWYKVVPMLRAAGHRVTALDMAASGAHPASMDEVPSFEDYTRPLLDAVAASPDCERLVLVGHSLGGLNLALAMERFPRKIAAAVFLAASMPCAGRHMGITIEEFLRRITPDFFMDSKRMVLNTSQGPRTAVQLGPKLMAAKLYDQSSTEDLTLATMLVRPGSQFMDDPIMEDETLLTDGNYGSVKRVFVIAMADTSSNEEMQRWMVDLSPGAEVEEIAGADHMAMCSKPRELCDVLLKIANKYD